MSNKTLSIWKSITRKPAGKWIFSKIVCFKAPYFGTIKPYFNELRNEYCEVLLKKRRGVTNHLGTVHAIAMCNMAELAGGTMTEATTPSTHRWIPKGMTVEYIKKAETNLKAIATPVTAMNLEQAGVYQVNVDIVDEQNEKVFHALIDMWVSPKKKN